MRPEDVAELGIGAESLEGFATDLLRGWGRRIGFDVALHASERGIHAAVGFSPRELERMAVHNDVYARELRPVKRAALSRRGVAIDSEVLAAASRSRLRYFVEMMDPRGGRHALLALGTVSGRVVSMTTLGRTGACFGERETYARSKTSCPSSRSRPLLSERRRAQLCMRARA